MPLKTLVEHDVRFLKRALVVSCSRCEMTLWASSPDAFTTPDGYIVCRGCLDPEEAPAPPAPAPERSGDPDFLMGPDGL